VIKKKYYKDWCKNKDINKITWESLSLKLAKNWLRTYHKNQKFKCKLALEFGAKANKIQEKRAKDKSKIRTKLLKGQKVGIRKKLIRI
jgi:hypothetical protein